MAKVLADELELLQYRLKTEQDNVTQFERKVRTLQGQIDFLKQENASISKVSEQTVSEREEFKSQATTLRRRVDQMQMFEQQAITALDERNDAVTQLAALQGKIDTTEGRLATLRHDRDMYREKVQKLEAEVEPVRALVVALQAREDAEKAVSEQINLLREIR